MFLIISILIVHNKFVVLKTITFFKQKKNVIFHFHLKNKLPQNGVNEERIADGILLLLLLYEVFNRQKIKQ